MRKIAMKYTPQTTLQKLGHQRKLEMLKLIYKCGHLTCRQVMDHLLTSKDQRSRRTLAGAMLRKSAAAGETIPRKDEWGHVYYFLGIKGARFLINNGVQVPMRSGRGQNINLHRSVSNTCALKHMRDEAHVMTFTDADIWGHSFVEGGAKRVPWPSWGPFLNKKPDVLSVFEYRQPHLEAVWVEVENCRRSDKDMETLINWIRVALAPALPMVLWQHQGRDVELTLLMFVMSKATASRIAWRIERALRNPPASRNADGSAYHSTPRRAGLNDEELARVSDRISFTDMETGETENGLPSFRC
jgi:hypothetical protein